MMRNIAYGLSRVKQLIPIGFGRCNNCITNRCYNINILNVYEPDYLECLKPKFPQYESLNVQITGYNYPILENYQRYLRRAAEYMDIEVEECYAMPPHNFTIQRFLPKSSTVEAEYLLNVYERNLQLVNVNAPIYPLFVRIAQAALPEGVELTIQSNTEEFEQRRYVPDRDLLDLKDELEKIQHSGTAKK